MRSRMFAMTLATTIASAVAAPGQVADAVSGTFTPVNAFDGRIDGTVSITPEGDNLTIRLEFAGISPGMHLVHIHGLPGADPENPVCPDAAADANADGFVDLIETGARAGITMIPFTDDPVVLAIQSENYLQATQDGRLTYERSVSYSSLRDAVEADFATPLAIADRVVFVHGAPEGTELPDSVQSLEGVPASVTIPSACAELDPA